MPGDIASFVLNHLARFRSAGGGSLQKTSRSSAAQLPLERGKSAFVKIILLRQVKSPDFISSRCSYENLARMWPRHYVRTWV
ncbi:unnamed protein product [Amoebophrya sp. A25]|nr:unnamed protein product [Amoebophrya sp. A25]|eukprot:GSA25T00013679001.1